MYVWRDPFDVSFFNSNVCKAFILRLYYRIFNVVNFKAIIALLWEQVGFVPLVFSIQYNELLRAHYAHQITRSSLLTTASEFSVPLLGLHLHYIHKHTCSN
jgi:hypothetical protein